MLFLVLLAPLMACLSLSLVGEINEYGDPENPKIIDVTRKKIFIPTHSRALIGQNLHKKSVNDGKAQPLTYVLTIINYIYIIAMTALSIVTLCTMLDVLFWVNFILLVVWYVVLLLILLVVWIRYCRRRKKQNIIK